MTVPFDTSVRLQRGPFCIWFGNCTKVRPLWSQVTEFIADTFDLLNVCNPLLGLLVDDKIMDNDTKTFLNILLVSNRELIVLNWLYTDILR